MPTIHSAGDHKYVWPIKTLFTCRTCEARFSLDPADFFGGGWEQYVDQPAHPTPMDSGGKWVTGPCPSCGNTCRYSQWDGTPITT